MSLDQRRETVRSEQVRPEQIIGGRGMARDAGIWGDTTRCLDIESSSSETTWNINRGHVSLINCVEGIAYIDVNDRRNNDILRLEIVFIDGEWHSRIDRPTDLSHQTESILAERLRITNTGCKVFVDRNRFDNPIILINSPGIYEVFGIAIVNGSWVEYTYTNMIDASTFRLDQINQGDTHFIRSDDDGIFFNVDGYSVPIVNSSGKWEMIVPDQETTPTLTRHPPPVQIVTSCHGAQRREEHERVVKPSPVRAVSSSYIAGIPITQGGVRPVSSSYIAGFGGARPSAQRTTDESVDRQLRYINNGHADRLIVINEGRHCIKIAGIGGNIYVPIEEVGGTWVRC